MRSSVIGLTAFLAVVELFALQAILPTLAHHYKSPPPRWVSLSMQARWAWGSGRFSSASRARRSIGGWGFLSALRCCRSRPHFSPAPHFVYLVFLPSILTTLLAGAAVRRFGTRASLCAGIGIAGLGLPMLLATALVPVLVGLALIAL